MKKLLALFAVALFATQATAITIGPGDPTAPKVCVIVNGQMFCN